LCDSLEFDKATEIAKETYEYYERIFEIQKSIYGNDNANVHDFGIINSQLGQCFAYSNNKEAEKSFKAALDLFDKGTPDYYQTESYLLHYYIQVGDSKNYSFYAKEFFGGNDDFLKQLEYVVNEGLKKSDPLISMRFALFVFIKGIYRFYLEDLCGGMADKIIHLESTLKDIDNRVEDHFTGYPWILIYKYLSLICISKNSEMSRDYLKKIKISQASFGIMDLMKQLSIYNIAVSLDDKALIKEASNRSVDSYNQLKDGKTKKDINEINKEITFIYC
jgi:hypothetical protein